MHCSDAAQADGVADEGELEGESSVLTATEVRTRTVRVGNRRGWRL